MKNCVPKSFHFWDETVLYGGWVDFTKMEAGEICRIKKSVFAAANKARARRCYVLEMV